VAQTALAEVAEDLQHLHQEWHAWEPSVLTKLNASLAKGETAPVSPTLRALIERSLSLAATTGGLFDPSVGGLMRLWGFHTSDFPITTPAPTREQIEAWRASSARYTDLVLTDAGLQSRNRNVQLDFGAIAEGMATERIVEILHRHGIHRALITLGGDLYAIGEAESRPWRAGLRDPFNLGGQPLATVELADGEALYSSGSYNRYRESPSGSRWPHVVDPHTGLPTQGIVGVNVLHPDPVIADVTSTALMVAGEAGFESVLRRMGVRCALLLTDSNELMMTAAMAERVSMLRDPLRLGPLIGTPGPCSQAEPDGVDSSTDKGATGPVKQR
jgi:thiamine biosynthesis lipoprotein